VGGDYQSGGRRIPSRHSDQEIPAITADGGGGFIFFDGQIEVGELFFQVVGHRPLREAPSIDPNQLPESPFQSFAAEIFFHGRECIARAAR